MKDKIGEKKKSKTQGKKQEYFQEEETQILRNV